MFFICHRKGFIHDVHKCTSIVMNSPISLGMIVIIKLRMMSKTFLACDFKLPPFYLHNANACAAILI